MGGTRQNFACQICCNIASKIPCWSDENIACSETERGTAGRFLLLILLNSWHIFFEERAIQPQPWEFHCFRQTGKISTFSIHLTYSCHFLISLCHRKEASLSLTAQMPNWLLCFIPYPEAWNDALLDSEATRMPVNVDRKKAECNAHF